MNACGGQLKVPHVPAGHRWTAPAVKAISNNRDLYIQATNSLKKIGVDETKESDFCRPLYSVPTPPSL